MQKTGDAPELWAAAAPCQQAEPAEMCAVGTRMAILLPPSKAVQISLIATYMQGRAFLET